MLAANVGRGVAVAGDPRKMQIFAQRQLADQLVGDQFDAAAMRAVIMRYHRDFDGRLGWRFGGCFKGA